MLDDPHHIPFVAEAEGDGIRKGATYARHGTMSEEATYAELQKMLNRRIETGYSSSREMTLEEHIAELRTLYGQIDERLVSSLSLSQTFRTLQSVLDNFMTQDNPDYPAESMDAFIARLIKVKKRRIQRIVEGKE